MTAREQRKCTGVMNLNSSLSGAHLRRARARSHSLRALHGWYLGQGGLFTRLLTACPQRVQMNQNYFNKIYCYGSVRKNCIRLQGVGLEYDYPYFEQQPEATPNGRCLSRGSAGLRLLAFRSHQCQANVSIYGNSIFCPPIFSVYVCSKPYH